LRRAERDGYNNTVTKFPRAPQRLTLLYIRDPLYFVTCCAYRRRPILAQTRFHDAVVDFVGRAETEFGIAVGRYVILPDHLHLFVSPSEHIELGRWIGTLKRITGRFIKPVDSPDPIWQRGFFDHVLRNTESYSQKWEYVRNNPVRAGLVTDPGDWPFFGEIAPLSFA